MILVDQIFAFGTSLSI